ncbi:MAG: S8 family serine peptidase ['Candidatus Kapabacteria' thiocyanatum]|uniref:Peptidase S8/S53 domain-containing protein n=1 Tax=Candidatus Kapaibacterium thiocyanatum TaxID=1895771 RepID=A0A1M3L5R8_9BACT|nr:S8 family serine peptidase ['Candidatus Kapabacteria' thiocyanatum]OJX60893.1 MAG: hypothetical protein BGO89_04835 ['Candidatus Kapabacteria' thiocyanatum]
MTSRSHHGRSLIVAMMMMGIVTSFVHARQNAADDYIAGRAKVRFSAEAMRTTTAERIAARNGMRIRYALLPFERSVTWRMQHSKNDGLLDANTTTIVALEEPLLRSFVVDVDEQGLSPDLYCRKIQSACGDIEIAEPAIRYRLCADTVNDPESGRQHLIQTIRLLDAWMVEAGSDTVRIGIGDTGIRQDHEDLKDAIAVNRGEIPDNGIDDDANGYVDDYRGYSFTTEDDGTRPGDTYNPTDGHGTGVAGICGATVNNNIGIVGIANRCRIVPLKTTPNGGSGIVFGYESIMYCALNGIDVVNCSWGSFSKSCIDESIIAYAIGRGTAVVAAAGNHGTTASFYPAAYPGVLGVGVTDPRDTVVGMSALGPAVDVMAPGQETVTTSNDGTYGTFCCTSGSAPIVSAIVGLVRSHHPSLTPLQACALAERAVTDIGALNPGRADLIGGRIDALKAVTLRPDSIPSLSVDTLLVAAMSGRSRWGVGDTVVMTVRLRNHLAPVTAGTATIDVVGDGAAAIRMLTGTIAIPSIATGAVATLEPIRCVVISERDADLFVRLRHSATTTAGDEHRQRYLLPVTPTPAFLTLRNDIVALSVGDKVRMGNTDLNKGQGEGLAYKGFCGQLYEGGLMISSRGRLVSSVRARRGIDDHFVPVKRFIVPDELQGSAVDAGAPDSLRLGVRVDQTVRLAGGDTAVYISDIVIENISDSTLDDVAAGWFMDWDLGVQPARNRTYFVNAMPSGVPLSMQIATSSVSDVAVACAVSSSEVGSTPVCAGIDNTVTYNGMSVMLKDSLLRNGTAVQYSGENDIAVVTGMRFPASLKAGQKRRFRLVIAFGDHPDSARSLAERYSAVPPAQEFHVGLPYPQPAGTDFLLPVDMVEPAMVTIRMYGIDGRLVHEQSTFLGTGSFDVPVPTTGIGTGAYVVRTTAGRHSATVPLVVVR